MRSHRIGGDGKVHVMHVVHVAHVFCVMGLATGPAVRRRQTELEDRKRRNVCEIHY
jgi:hypothetical protein